MPITPERDDELPEVRCGVCFFPLERSDAGCHPRHPIESHSSTLRDSQRLVAWGIDARYRWTTPLGNDQHVDLDTVDQLLCQFYAEPLSRDDNDDPWRGPQHAPGAVPAPRRRRAQRVTCPCGDPACSYLRPDTLTQGESSFRATQATTPVSDNRSMPRTVSTPGGTMNRCTRCRELLPVDDFRYVASHGRYHSWCRACERAARRSSSRRTTTTRRTRTSPRGRAFGVEIELTGPSQTIIVNALSQIGINVRVRGYAVTSGNNWELKHDGSVRGEGLELVSPKLYGEEGQATVRRVLDAINAVGATVDRSCGIHVHVDFRGRNVAQIRDAVLPILRSQDAIYSMCAPSRRSNHYSPAWTESQLQQLRGATEASTIAYMGPRGFVNLQAFPRHGSVEFRSHGGSTNPTKILAWVRMLLAAVAWGESHSGTSLSLGGTAQDVCETLSLSHDDTRALTRFVRAAADLEAAEYAGTVA